MGVRRAAPWWLTWAFFAGLVLLFTGERILGTFTWARVVVSGLGALVVLASAVWRFLSWRNAEGEARGVERMLLVTYGGVLLSLLLYLVSSDDGIRWLGLEFESDEARATYEVVLRVLWPILLAISLLPALGAQIAIGAHRHARAAGTGMEALRVRGTARSALTLALAGAFFFVLGYITTARDETLDLSYFRTASPGTATIAMVEAMTEPLRVMLFYPPVNAVKEEALRYFNALADATGGRVQIETYDRFLTPNLAEQHSITEDGVAILAVGDRTERLVIGSDMSITVRRRLRRLDAEVQPRLMMLLRERRTVYLTAGHGELNDPSSVGPLAAEGLGEVRTFREILNLLNFDVQNLSVANGLAREVPRDAALVAILGPRRPFLPEELDAIDRYLAGGGSLLLAFEHNSEFELGPLEKWVRVRFVPEPLTDEDVHMVRRNNPSDRRLILTDRFAVHSAVSTASRAGSGIMLIGSGHLEALPDPPEAESDSGEEPPRPVFVVRSLPSTFADVNDNFVFDAGVEQKKQYNIASAIEIPLETESDSEQEEGPDTSVQELPEPPAELLEQEVEEENRLEAVIEAARAAARNRQPEPKVRTLVYADSELFTDAVLNQIGLNAALVADGVRWLASEESLSGVVESEEDVPIEHTRAEDVAWFYTTILGAPMLVLTLGLTGVYIRRRRPRFEATENRIGSAES